MLNNVFSGNKTFREGGGRANSSPRSSFKCLGPLVKRANAQGKRFGETGLAGDYRCTGGGLNSGEKQTSKRGIVARHRPC